MTSDPPPNLRLTEEQLSAVEDSIDSSRLIPGRQSHYDAVERAVADAATDQALRWAANLLIAKAMLLGDEPGVGPMHTDFSLRAAAKELLSQIGRA